MQSMWGCIEVIGSAGAGFAALRGSLPVAISPVPSVPPARLALQVLLGLSAPPTRL